MKGSGNAYSPNWGGVTCDQKMILDFENLREKLIYSDPGFIALVYEELTNNSPQTQISTGLTLGVNASAGFAGLSGSSQETKTFSISTFRMLKEIADELMRYPEIKPEENMNAKATQTCWFRGHLTIGEWGNATGPRNASMQFEIVAENDVSITLVTQNSLFLASVGNLLQMDSVVSMNMDIPVVALGRFLFHNSTIRGPVVAPYLILEP